ncbi:MAG: ATP-dependent DNA ligase [Gemmatimonadetes bacterium 13_1_40CM_3_65_8]|nr:MAG: ATP-dependent DNA ligase [Gemmatimonadetes bacterium 13_1_40CM_4_65_7]OLD01142.1 MAG: ATP-dependent DNA ligase [Gemmatimonadetes bacterium 13_1_40CM_3_65_8]
MLLNLLVETSEKVASTSGRLAKTKLLAELLKQAAPDEIETVIAYLSGTIRQAKVGVGWATLEAARSSPPRESVLTIQDVDNTLDLVANASGKGSAATKTKLLRELFGRATEQAQDFLFRLLTGELRQGALELIMVEAVAKALELPAADVRRAAMLSGDLGAVAKAGTHGLAQFRVRLFRPIKPMLAQTANDVAEALERSSPAAFEYKFDGARIQVHKQGDDVKVFSRLMNDVTVAVPEVVDAARVLEVKEVILDGEAIALTTDNRPLPFQTTMRRFGRKLDVETLQGELPLVPFFFDILYLDGESLMDQPYSTRFKVLSQHVCQRPPRLVTADKQEAQRFFEEAIKAGHEGLMVKRLDARYEAGGRTWDWIKVKKANTLDLVVLAAEWGHGRRKGWLSNLHLGARDPAGGFVMLGKTFKGMTDELLEWQTKKLQELETRREGIVVFVRPELVVEVAFNGLQESSVYPGGLALRFARVVQYRQDKKPEEADTIEMVRRLHQG